ncbi:60 kDa SS-A/Ro ribonucleoprotein-like [Dendronephthya gigantea]|uniref:60 kDa SS-A/Ro ribonucleoprotein-like n=1 Tax=Dendronephthya gigantea TaxID=151771 RepID=UPI00106DBE74|nr:60 kDa SS-A/Ro ribonucleoprotein-like [Dendronephthya gigantea]
MEVDENLVTSNVGGSVWQVDDMKRLHRFLVLGSESPTYYITDGELQKENARVVSNLMQAGRGVEVVNEIREYSVKGRTIKQNPIMFALALCARQGDLATKRRAYEVLPEVCRIPTHLFMFVGLCEKHSIPAPGAGPNATATGWGRAHRKAIKKWYITKCKKPLALAMNVTKYQKREGWSHRDVARLMHLNPTGTDVTRLVGPEEPENFSDGLSIIMKYIARGWSEVTETYANRVANQEIGPDARNVFNFLKAVEDVKTMTAENESDIIDLILQFHLVREHIPTSCLSLIGVWRALLTNMPMMAMIRNLGKMTSVGLLCEGGAELTQVCAKLKDHKLLRNARIHPFNALVAMKTYMDGHGDRGKLRWKPIQKIVDALESAFYFSFKLVESTKKRYLLALDVSRSMSYVGVVGSPCITPRVASAAMSMVVAKTEETHNFVAFSHKIEPLVIDRDMSLDDVLLNLEQIKMGGTDCALPMLYAIEKNLKVDVFVVYTDCETMAGPTHPANALRLYREHSGIRDAKLIVVAMTSNGFTIADPDDQGMFDIVGFDAEAPNVMREFILGNI